jgi:pimeloyl-ACP methyl ester carboxylesterase
MRPQSAEEAQMNTSDCYGGVEPRRDHMQVGTMKLAFLEWGSAGAPMLLLHGITSSARAWWRFAPALVERGYHVYAVDMPGHGQSDIVADYRPEQLASVVAELLRRPALAGAAVIGHSWGGAVALVLASRARELGLSRVLLIDPALAMNPVFGAEMLTRYIQNVGTPRDEALPLVRAQNPLWHACDCYWKAEALEHCRLDSVRSVFIDSGVWNLSPLLAQTAVPLLLLLADPAHSIIAPPVLAEARQALASGTGRLVVLPGTTHNLLRDNFEISMHAVLPWLQESFERKA